MQIKQSELYERESACCDKKAGKLPNPKSRQDTGKEKEEGDK